MEQDDELLSAREVGKRYGISRETVWRWARDNRIPRPVMPFKKWRKSEVIGHIKSLEHAQAVELAS